MPDILAADPTQPQPSPLVAADPSLGDHLPAPNECSMYRLPERISDPTIATASPV